MNDSTARFLRFIRDPESKSARTFEGFILLLVFYSLLIYSLETLPGLSQQLRSFLSISESVVGSLFVLEYSLRVTCSRRPLRYIFSFYGVIDLFAVLPLVLGIGTNGTIIRTLRIFRIFRILKLSRYSKSVERFIKAVTVAREDLVIFSLASVLLVFMSSVGIYHFEHNAQPDKFPSILHCMWWSVVTLTTVGYGDAFPITVGGKLFTSLVLACGVGIVAIPAGLLASALTKVREDEQE